MKSILLVKELLGLAEMTFGLVTASFSLPEGQAVKKIFFARCLTKALLELYCRHVLAREKRKQNFVVYHIVGKPIWL